MRSLVGDLLAPSMELSVEIVDAPKYSGREERVTKILNLSFDTTLFVSAGRRTGTRSEVIVSGKLKQAWMEPYRTCVSLEHRAFQVVVEETSGDSAES